MKSNFPLLKTVLFIIMSVQFSCSQIEPNEPGALVPKTVDQDFSIPTIHVNGTMLHAEAYGDPNDNMLIFIHGGPGSDYRNALQVNQLQDDGYYVVFYDQRGTGLSKRENKDIFTNDLMIEDLDAVIEYYKNGQNQKVFLFGHSWGAMLATGYINKYPEKIKGVILAEPGGFNWNDTKDYIDKSRRMNFFNEGVNDFFYLNQFLTGKESEHEILDYKAAIQSASAFSKDNEEGIEGPSPFFRYGKVSSDALFRIAEDEGFDFTPNLSQYETRVLFLYSELNKAYGLEHAQKVSSAYPNVQLAKINNTGHEMIYFNWPSIYPKVVSYLNSLN